METVKYYPERWAWTCPVYEKSRYVPSENYTEREPEGTLFCENCETEFKAVDESKEGLVPAELLRSLLNKVNQVTSRYRHGRFTSNRALRELSDHQIDVENELVALFVAENDDCSVVIEKSRLDEIKSAAKKDLAKINEYIDKFLFDHYLKMGEPYLVGRTNTLIGGPFKLNGCDAFYYEDFGSYLGLMLSPKFFEEVCKGSHIERRFKELGLEQHDYGQTVYVLPKGRLIAQN